MPDLLYPWFASDHEAVLSPLFVDVSPKGTVFRTDDSAKQLFFFRQTPVPRKLYFVSKGSQEVDTDQVPFAPETIKSSSLKWKSISGLCRVKYQYCEKTREALVVADRTLGSIRCFKDIQNLW